MEKSEKCKGLCHMTEKLYYENSHIRSFSARVTACEAAGDTYEVELSATAFFPGGGGQLCDGGTVGGVPLLSVREEGEHIYHRLASPLEPGREVECELDWEMRFGRMQLHSAEHIVCGLAHRRWGAENSGFHMNPDSVTLDLTVELSEEELLWLEREANRIVWANTPFRCWFPEKEELAALPYRSKKELMGDVRLVEIEGVDLCACCAPHVQLAGEIGLIRLPDAMRHRGGMRITLRAGRFALEEEQKRGAVLGGLSSALSVPPERLGEAVERLLSTLERQKAELSQLQRAAMETLARSAEPENGALLFFVDACDRDALRALVNLGLEKCALCAAFSGQDGAWQYILGSRGRDLRAESRSINAAIRGKGGGSPEMLQGSCSASRQELEHFWEEFHG